MKRLLFAVALFLCAPMMAHAQCNGVFAAGTVCGNPSGSPAPPKPAASLYFDTSGSFTDRGSKFTIFRDLGDITPTGIQANIWSAARCHGDNSTFAGCSGGFFKAADRSDATPLNKGVLYGVMSSIAPTVARDNPPVDDTANFIAQNEGTYRGRALLYGGRNTEILDSGGEDYEDAIQIDSWTQLGLLRATGQYGIGIDFASNLNAEFTSGNAIRLPNVALVTRGGTGSAIAWRNAANTEDVKVLNFTSGNRIQIGPQTTSVSTSLVMGLFPGSSPSLSSDTYSVAKSIGSSVQLTEGGYATGGFGYWLQTKQTTNAGTSWPILLNPLGGNVGVGLGNVTPSDKLTVNGAVGLGVAGSQVGSSKFYNATSGSITLQPVTGALGSAVLSLPAATDTLVGKATTDTLTNKTVSGSNNTITNIAISTSVSGLGAGVATLLGTPSVTNFAAAITGAYSGTISVRKGDDSGSCDITVSGGLISSHTC